MKLLNDKLSFAYIVKLASTALKQEEGCADKVE